MIETKAKDCYILEPKKFGDDRGYYQAFYVDKTSELSMKGIVQGARSKSSKGVIRGLHIQKDPLCQSKLVECLSGAVLDFAVDIRKDSPTYKQAVYELLTPENGRQLFVPRGFLHGFIALEDNTLFQYLVDSDYSPAHEMGVKFDDPDFKIDLDSILKEYGIDNPLYSDKDRVLKTLDESNLNFYMNYDYLVTGVNGQLGHDVVKELNSRGIYNVLGLDVADMDITNERIVNKIVSEYKPKHIIHCAAYTAVDKAEEDSTIAYKVNVEGTKNLVNAARNIDATFTYISTDYVFDGTKEGLYEVDDETNPCSVYGQTKLDGENLVRNLEKYFVVRTSWVFGLNGNNFIKTMLRLSESRDELSVVNDQFGSPTYTKDLAKLLVDMQDTNKYGTYHVNNEGYCSWCDFAKYIFEKTNKDMIVNGIPTVEYPTPATRPLNSKLSKDCLDRNGFERLPSWENAVDRYLDELKEI